MGTEATVSQRFPFAAVNKVLTPLAIVAFLFTMSYCYTPLFNKYKFPGQQARQARSQCFADQRSLVFSLEMYMQDHGTIVKKLDKDLQDKMRELGYLRKTQDARSAHMDGFFFVGTERTIFCPEHGCPALFGRIPDVRSQMKELGISSGPQYERASPAPISVAKREESSLSLVGFGGLVLFAPALCCLLSMVGTTPDSRRRFFCALVVLSVGLIFLFDLNAIGKPIVHFTEGDTRSGDDRSSAMGSRALE